MSVQERYRTNVLLIGDSAGDINMTTGEQKNLVMHYWCCALTMPCWHYCVALTYLTFVLGMQFSNVLRVGYLNDSVDARFPLYLTLYDVVIVGDPGFEVPLSILNRIVT
jgi:hypothetical protein